MPARREAHPIRVVVEVHERERFTNAFVQQRSDVMEIARAEQRDRRFDLCIEVGESLPCLCDRFAARPETQPWTEIAQINRAYRLPRCRVAERGLRAQRTVEIEYLKMHPRAGPPARTQAAIGSSARPAARASIVARVADRQLNRRRRSAQRPCRARCGAGYRPSLWRRRGNCR